MITRWMRGAVPARRVCAPLTLVLAVITALSLIVAPLLAQEKKPSTPPDFNLTAAGDVMIVTPLTARQSDPEFMSLVNAVRKADAAVLNLEGTFAGEDAYPIADTGVTWMASAPERLKDLQWMGFNLFSAANNHSADFGIQGLLDTIRVFQQSGAVYAGIGKNLSGARAPGYLTTAHGRVALVSCASTFSVEAPAGQTRPDMRGRPGLSALHHETIYRVDAATFNALRKLKQDFQPVGGQAAAGDAQTLKIAFEGAGPITFELAGEPGVITKPNPRDVAEMTHSIRDAKEMANYVVAYLHAHEQDPGSVEVPAQFVVEYAHASIDAGADVFAASGPHLLRGIEIYKGKVILYSLGNWIFENDLVVPQPADLYQTYGLGPDALPSEVFDARSDHGRRWWPSEPRDWETVLANVAFHNGVPNVVTLTPVTLGYGELRPDRGHPKFANPAMAAKILERLQKLSQPYGTNIAIKNGVGTITIEQPNSMK
jgi:poly-gamma-glutamate capsule biosynthesis protein CapA/YwtB (metallophosphatase superfamily)